MSQQSGFFNAKVVEGEFDRVYLAETFARYFSSFIGNGVFAGISSALQITQTPTSSFATLVQPGQAWINGYWVALDDEPHPLTISLPDGVRPRIDSVVARYGTVDREITFLVKTGVPAISPVAPGLQRDADAYELQLATVYVRAGSLSIRQQDITDTRPISEVCGWVHGVVEQIDTTTLGNQLQSFIDEYKARFDQDYQDFLIWLEDLRQLAQQAYNDFLAYLASLRTAGDSELASLVSYLITLRSSAQLQHDEFIAFLQALQLESTGRVQELIDELEAMLAGEPFGDLLLRVIALEDLRAITEIAVIEHDLGEYCRVDLYEYALGAGIGGAGVSGAGGTSLTSSPTTYDLHEKSTITVRARQALGSVVDVVPWGRSRFVVNFSQQDKSVLVVLTPHTGGLPSDILGRIEQLEQTLFNNFVAHDTQVLFETLDELAINGSWDETRRRLEI